MRVLVVGQVISDIDSYNGVLEVLQVWVATASRSIGYSEGLGKYLQYDTTSNGYLEALSI